jgi:hypothetical protein
VPFTLGENVVKSDLAERTGELQNLQVRCKVYFKLVNGSNRAPSSAALLVESFPNGITKEQKWDIGAYHRKGGLTELIDAV